MLRPHALAANGSNRGGKALARTVVTIVAIVVALLDGPANFYLCLKHNRQDSSGASGSSRLRF